MPRKSEMTAEKILEAKKFYVEAKKMAATYGVSLRIIASNLNVRPEVISDCGQGKRKAPVEWSSKLKEMEKFFAVGLRAEEERAEVYKTLKREIVVWSMTLIKGKPVFLISKSGLLRIITPLDSIYDEVTKIYEAKNGN